jgi:hypothetical protein
MKIRKAKKAEPMSTIEHTEKHSTGVASKTGREPQEWICEPGDYSDMPGRPYQELWFELRSWAWKSLAVVPTVSGSSEFALAEQVVVVGVSNTNRRMSLISAEGVGVGDTDKVIAMIRAAEARGDRVVVVTDSIFDNPASTPIIRAVNGVIPVVKLGKSERATVEKTIQAVGRSRVIGAVSRH